MRKAATIFLAIGIFSSGFGGVVQAAGSSHGGGGGHVGHFGGSGHFGGRIGGGHFGGYRGSHFGGYGDGYGYGLGFGLGFGDLYYGGYPYWDRYSPYDYVDPYDDDSVAPSLTYPESDQAAVAMPPSGSGDSDVGTIWYYCDSPEGYYPYIRNCRHNWQPVPAAPPSGPGGDN